MITPQEAQQLKSQMGGGTQGQGQQQPQGSTDQDQQQQQQPQGSSDQGISIDEALKLRQSMGQSVPRGASAQSQQQSSGETQEGGRFGWPARAILSLPGSRVPMGALQGADKLLLKLSESGLIGAGVAAKWAGSHHHMAAIAKAAPYLDKVADMIKSRRTMQADVPGVGGKIGRGIGEVGAFAAALPEFATEEGAGLAAKVAGVGKRIAAGGVLGAASAPESPKTGAMVGAGGVGAVEAVAPVARGALSLMKNAPNMFVGRFAKTLENLYEAQKGIAKELYSKAFKGTEKITPELSGKTQGLLSDLKEEFPGKASKVSKAINRYEEAPTLEKLHRLKSDLGKANSDLSDKAIKSGLSGKESDMQGLFMDTNSELTNDLESNMKKVSAGKHNEYQAAQDHYRENVVPFKQYPSLKKLLGRDRDITPRLYSDLAKDAIGAEKIRAQLGISRSALKIGSLMRNKLLTYPALGLLGGSAGLSLGHKLLGEG